MVSPLTDEDLREINKNLKALKETKTTLRRAAVAGLNVAEQEAEADALIKTLTGVKQAFFSNV